VEVLGVLGSHVSQADNADLDFGHDSELLEVGGKFRVLRARGPEVRRKCGMAGASEGEDMQKSDFVGN
jgi:hypothetical protein